MREKYKQFKEFISVPKNKSFTLLAIYGIFFIFVFIVINTSKYSSTPIVDDKIQDEVNDEIKEETGIKQVDSYEYIYEFNINNVITNINGTYYNDEQLLSIEQTKYYIKNGISYLYSNQLIEQNIDYPIEKLTYNNIHNLINNFEYESKTEYKDRSIKYEYIISNLDFSKYYNEENIYEGNVYINIYENNYINKVDIDLSSYYNINKYLISINYSNINNIDSLDINILENNN